MTLHRRLRVPNKNGGHPLFRIVGRVSGVSWQSHPQDVLYAKPTLYRPMTEETRFPVPGSRPEDSTSTVGRGKSCNIAIAPKPMQCKATRRSSLASISARNAFQGSGGRLCGLGQELGVQIRQQIPVIGFGGGVRLEPAAFCIRERCLAQGNFLDQTRMVQGFFNLAKPRSNGNSSPSLCDLPR